MKTDIQQVFSSIKRSSISCVEQEIFLLEWGLLNNCSIDRTVAKCLMFKQFFTDNNIFIIGKFKTI